MTMEHITKMIEKYYLTMRHYNFVKYYLNVNISVNEIFSRLNRVINYRII